MHVGHFAMAFKKIMRPNNSAFPNEHESAIDALVMLNSSFILELLLARFLTLEHAAY